MAAAASIKPWDLGHQSCPADRPTPPGQSPSDYRSAAESQNPIAHCKPIRGSYTSEFSTPAGARNPSTVATVRNQEGSCGKRTLGWLGMHRLLRAPFKQSRTIGEMNTQAARPLPAARIPKQTAARSLLLPNSAIRSALGLAPKPMLGETQPATAPRYRGQARAAAKLGRHWLDDT